MVPTNRPIKKKHLAPAFHFSDCEGEDIVEAEARVEQATPNLQLTLKKNNQPIQIPLQKKQTKAN